MILKHIPAAATLSTSYVGRPCPEELVTFTCRVSGVDLLWNPSDASSISLNTLTPLNTPQTRGQYTATLVLISNIYGLVSTLSTTARNGVTVECLGPSTLVGSVTMILVGEIYITPDIIIIFLENHVCTCPLLSAYLQLL